MLPQINTAPKMIIVSSPSGGVRNNALLKYMSDKKVGVRVEDEGRGAVSVFKWPWETQLLAIVGLC